MPCVRYRAFLCIACLFVATLPLSGSSQDFELVDVSASSGLDFQHFSGKTGKNFILETVTCGLATFDYDSDGLIDIYLPSGNSLQGVAPKKENTNRLFRNLGAMTFEDVTHASGAGDLSFAMGVVAGDLDDDGDPDLLLTNYGPNVILENNGDGTFLRRTFIDDPTSPRVSAGASLFDYDADGYLDIFVSRYVKFDFSKDVNRTIFGVPAAPGPKEYEPDTDSLFRNLGNGKFEDVSKSSLIADQAGAGMGAIAFDYESDGDEDIFVCNDSGANFLYENQGDGTFVESGLLSGLAYDVSGAAQASMGVDIADLDHDGLQDVVTTNFLGEIPTLYQNSGDAFFDDVGAAAGLGRADNNVSWGIGLVDLDNDSWHDCFIVAGHLIEGISKVTDSDQFEAEHILLRNQAGKFVPANVVGDALASIKVSRGAAFDDLDNDGRLDAVVLNLNSTPQLIHNQTPKKNHFFRLRLIGRKNNRSAAGVKINVAIGDKRLVSQRVVGRSYQSHFGDTIHFGIGTATQIDSLEILWPDGHRQEISSPPIDRELLVVESGR